MFWCKLHSFLVTQQLSKKTDSENVRIIQRSVIFSNRDILPNNTFGKDLVVQNTHAHMRTTYLDRPRTKPAATPYTFANCQLQGHQMNTKAMFLTELFLGDLNDHAPDARILFAMQDMDRFPWSHYENYQSMYHQWWYLLGGSRRQECILADRLVSMGKEYTTP